MVVDSGPTADRMYFHFKKYFINFAQIIFFEVHAVLQTPGGLDGLGSVSTAQPSVV